MYNQEQLLKVLAYAKDCNATNLHITAGAVPAVRVEGMLKFTPFESIQPMDTENILSALLNEEQKSTLKVNRYLSLPVAFKNIGRLRANIFMQRGSFSISFKLLDRLLKTPEELNIPPVVMDLHKLKSGLILICGDSGSIPATRAAIIKKISETRACHIITVEDPIEYLFKHDQAIVNQKEIGIDANSYQEGVYSAITQDPDVIMVGFCGDPETFSAALTAAENGHLVVASLHTGGAVKTIRYIINMFTAEKRDHIQMQLHNVFQAIVSQQIIPAKNGTSGVTAMEILLATSATRHLIIENKIHQLPEVIKASKALGMITMEDAINALYARGLISRENALYYSSQHQG